MKKHFYSHIISVEVLEPSLNKASISVDEKKELLEIAERTLHFTILDTVMSQLSEDDKKIFLNHAHEEEHTKLWEHLVSKEKSIEKKVHDAGQKILLSLEEDIKEMIKK